MKAKGFKVIVYTTADDDTQARINAVSMLTRSDVYPDQILVRRGSLPKPHATGTLPPVRHVCPSCGRSHSVKKGA